MQLNVDRTSQTTNDLTMNDFVSCLRKHETVSSWNLSNMVKNWIDRQRKTVANCGLTCRLQKENGRQHESNPSVSEQFHTQDRTSRLQRKQFIARIKNNQNDMGLHLHFHLRKTADDGFLLYGFLCFCLPEAGAQTHRCCHHSRWGMMISSFVPPSSQELPFWTGFVNK